MKLGNAVAFCLLFTMARIPAAPDDPTPKEIEELVDQLVGIDSPDYGLSGTFSGTDFPPVAGQGQFGSGLLKTDHGVRRSGALIKLVSLGARALPHVANHASDKRPTKLEFTHGGGFGAMWHATEVPFNEKNEGETRAIEAAGLKNDAEPGGQNHVSKHVVTVGDACFVITGMITNRPYNALRYQPTACKVVNSPTHSPAIAEFLKDRWGRGDDIEERLYQHLKLDFETSDWHNIGGAANRLLFYFPDRSVPVVISHLDQLLEDLERDPEGSTHPLREFISAIAWHENAEIQSKIRSLFYAAPDIGVALSCLAAFGDSDASEKLRDRLAELLEEHTEEEVLYPNRVATILLENLIGWFHDEAAATLEAYIKPNSPARWMNVAEVFYRRGAFAESIDIIKPSLADHRWGFGRYITDGDGVHEKVKGKHFTNHRLCDNFYEIISHALGDQKTKCTGSPAEMDAKIAILTERLKRPLDEWLFSAAEITERQAHQQKVLLAKQSSDDALGERGRLLKYVFPPGKREEGIDKARLAKIAELYPEELDGIYQRILREKPHLSSYPVIAHIHKKRPAEIVAKLLIEGTKHESFKHREAALFGLLDAAPDIVPALLIDTLEALPKKPDGPYWSHGPGGFGNLAIRANTPEVWAALLKTAKRVDTGSRLEILNVIIYQDVADSLESRIEFLSEFIDDSSTADVAANRHMFGGPHANFITPGRSVDELAYRQIGWLLELPEARGNEGDQSKVDKQKLKDAVDAKLGRR